MTPPELTRIALVGHPRHGKSTLVGRLLRDTASGLDPVIPTGDADERGGVPESKVEQTDSLLPARRRDRCPEMTRTWIETAHRRVGVIDIPGGQDFIEDLITALGGVQAAFLLIDAQDGPREGFFRHACFLQLFAVRRVLVLINKMDLAGYSRARFDALESECRRRLNSIGLDPGGFVPIVATDGDNVVRPSEKMNWWNGPTVFDALSELSPSPPADDLPLRLPIQDLYHVDGRCVLAGHVASGLVREGDRIVFSPSNKSSTVKRIERWNAPSRSSAGAGESIGITLADDISVERGAIAAHEKALPYELSRFKARVFWLDRNPLRMGRAYQLRLATQETDCEVESVEQVIDTSTLSRSPRRDAASSIGRPDVGELTLKTAKPIAFDAACEIGATGRFVIVDGGRLAGGGIVLQDNYPRRTGGSRQKSQNIYWTSRKLTPAQRRNRNGHAGCVIWLTGLSGSGKSTLAADLERALFDLGRQVYVLDGDNIRHGLCADLAFASGDRRENIRRVGEVAKLFADAGMICITAFISPYRSDRDLVRRSLGQGEFIEVYVNAPIEVCVQRDTKGLYAKARAGEIPEFTGVSAPYEAPMEPEVEVRTDQLSVADSVGRIVKAIESMKTMS